MIAYSGRRAAFRGTPVQALVTALAVLLLAAAVAPQARAEVETPADYAIMIDHETGLVLFEKNAHELMAPASMSKLMTLLMAFERLDDGRLSLDEEIYISENAWRKGGAASGSSTMFAEVGSEIPLKDILRGIIVQSGNDACIALAEKIGGTEAEFARMMTQRAREMGLDKSTFANATGWPDENHEVTAAELAQIASHIVRNHPEHFKIFSQEEFTWNGITQQNRNPLLYRMEEADGLKTGHTSVSGYGLVGTAEREGRRLILVVNGLESERQRAEETRRLMELGFNAYDRYDLFAEGETVSEAEVFAGAQNTVPLVLGQDVKVMMRKSARNDMQVSINYTGPIEAPIQAGQPVATLRVSVPDKQPMELPLYAGAPVAKAGIWKRMGMAVNHLVFGGAEAEDEAAGAGADVSREIDAEPRPAQ